MSSSDSIDAPTDPPEPPEHSVSDDVDPAIEEAVDSVTNRFGAQGLEQMIAYAETSLADARAALAELADATDATDGDSAE